MRSSVRFAAIIVAVIVGGILPGATQQLPSGGGPVPELRRGANGQLEAVPALGNSAPAPTRPKTSAAGPPTAGSPVLRAADTVGRHDHGPSISATPTVAHVGDKLTVSVANTPNTKNKDWVAQQVVIGPTEPSASTIFGLNDITNYVPAGQHDWTFTVPVPNVRSDWPIRYRFVLQQDDTYTNTAATAVVTVAPSLPHTAPTAKAPDFTAPFTPAQTLKVCASGCNYTTVRDAVVAAKNVDNTLITVAPGDYYDDCVVVDGPAHLWIKGIGGRFPHLAERTKDCGFGIINWSNGTRLVIDNLEISDIGAQWHHQAAGVRIEWGHEIWLRNNYIHDGSQGFISGRQDIVGIFEHNHFARLGHNGNHNVYFEGADLRFRNNLSEQTHWGHELKTRSKANIACNTFIEGYDPVYRGSRDIDLSEGRPAQVHHNVIAKGPYATGSPYVFSWAADREYRPYSEIPWWLNIHDNLLINDMTKDRLLYGYIGVWAVYPDDRRTGLIDLMRYKSTDNIFVGQGSAGSEMYEYGDINPWMRNPNAPVTHASKEMGGATMAVTGGATGTISFNGRGTDLERLGIRPGNLLVFSAGLAEADTGALAADGSTSGRAWHVTAVTPTTLTVVSDDGNQLHSAGPGIANYSFAVSGSHVTVPRINQSGDMSYASRGAAGLGENEIPDPHMRWPAICTEPVGNVAIR